jgi:4-hydroxy-4-methyl-2-oxoglutarate aldolase
MRCAGTVLPLQYDGAPERFFQVLENAKSGDVLVLDNAGRQDESCMGDVMACELRNAGLGGLIIWGLHRDTEVLIKMGWPIFSIGTHPCANTRDATDTALARTAKCGEAVVSSDDFVVGDRDGVVFIDSKEMPRVIEAALSIADREARLISKMEGGTSLRTQLDYDGFVRRRCNDPSRSFRDHIKDLSRPTEAGK